MYAIRLSLNVDTDSLLETFMAQDYMFNGDLSLEWALFYETLAASSLLSEVLLLIYDCQSFSNLVILRQNCWQFNEIIRKRTKLHVPLRRMKSYAKSLNICGLWFSEKNPMKYSSKCMTVTLLQTMVVIIGGKKGELSALSHKRVCMCAWPPGPGWINHRDHLTNNDGVSLFRKSTFIEDNTHMHTHLLHANTWLNNGKAESLWPYPITSINTAC